MTFNKTKIIKLSAVVFIILLSFAYGVVIGKFKHPPYAYIHSAYKLLFHLRDEQVTDKNKNYVVTQENINKLIEIQTESNIMDKRSRLIRYIWKSDGIIKINPVVDQNITDERYSNLANLARIDKITIDMAYGINSIAYYFVPAKANNKLILYHQGHGGDFFRGYTTIEEFIQKGYAVIGLTMPLHGMNNQPFIDVPRFGKFKFVDHSYFEFLDNDGFSSIKLFIDPVISLIDYAQSLGYAEIGMVGMSGGGWTTLLASAIDTRIAKSYSVAGSEPMYLRVQDQLGEWKGWKDKYEQTLIPLYQIANYLELYVMSSYGDNRRHAEILNIYDSCCFFGYRYEAYENIVYESMQKLGKGRFLLITDDTHSEHKISHYIRKFILKDIGE